MAKTMSATDRVLEAADGAGLGPWSESDEINVGDNDATMPIFGVGLLVGCSAWFLVPLGVAGWLLRESHPVVGWVMLAVAVVLSALGLLVFGGALVRGLTERRDGKLLLHEFADGLVLERTGGRVYAVRYDETDVELFKYENRGTDETNRWIDWMVLLRFPDGTSTTVRGMHRTHALQRRLAQRCGTELAGTTITVSEAVDLRHAHRWL